MDRGRVVNAAAIIMLGNLVTSLLGFVRAFVMARYFGANGNTNAFFAALVVPQMFYDLLIGGAVSAALIPSFTRLAGEDRDRLWRVVATVFVLVVVVLVAVVLILEVAARPLMTVIASGYVHTGSLSLSVRLVRVLLPTLVFLGLSAAALATLYSLRRMVVASFATMFYHLGVIVAAVVASRQWGIVALPVGALAGAALQFGAQVPAIMLARRRGGSARGRVRVVWNDPALRHILRLYAPVAAGIVISIAGQVADVNFKSYLPQHDGLTAMQYATQLIQFPVGIVVAAIGLAVLPAMSADAAAARLAAMKETLMLGFRLVLILMVPAAAGLLVLALPIVAALFQRGQFTHAGSLDAATALMGYAPQLPFVGIDQLLIMAFYARHNTVTPMLVGVAGVALYVVTAALLLRPLSILGLALANTIQITGHALILLVLLRRAIGSLPLRSVLVTGGKVALATGVMAVIVLAVGHRLLPADMGRYTHFLQAFLPMLAGALAYLALVVLLRVEEIHVLWQAVAARIRGRDISAALVPGAD